MSEMDNLWKMKNMIDVYVIDLLDGISSKGTWSRNEELEMDNL